MKLTISSLGLLLLLTAGQIAFGQTNKEKAFEKGQQAIKLDDEGKYDDAIKLFEEAQVLAPDYIEFPYELAYAYYQKKDYKRAIEYLEGIVNHPKVYDQVFQLLGNSYDYMGNPDKAFEIYDAGIKIFPKSGKLYLEKGNIYWQKKEYGKALSFYEKGIEADPKFASNYYRAARVYCGSTEEVWGMIYGEIFINLERNTDRTAEISKLLYDTYKHEIKFTTDTSFSVSFSQNSSINIKDLKNPKNFKLPFGTGCYEMVLMMSVLGEKIIDLNSIDRIRKKFIENYFKNDNDKKYPNVLFEYQNQILQAGHLEAYNHWMLMKGDEDGFKTWHKDNKEKWDHFVTWFSDNQLQLDDTHKFYSGQY